MLQKDKKKWMIITCTIQLTIFDLFMFLFLEFIDECVSV